MSDILSFQGENRYLSNFYPAVLPFDGLSFPTSEHAYQAAKTLDFNHRLAISLIPADQPREAKKAGRHVVLRVDWEQIRVPVMMEVVTAKFAHNPPLRARLISTGAVRLVEGNYWHDQYWGDCTCIKHREIPGVNALGQILTLVRTLLG